MPFGLNKYLAREEQGELIADTRSDLDIEIGAALASLRVAYHFLETLFEADEVTLAQLDRLDALRSGLRNLRADLAESR